MAETRAIVTAGDWPWPGVLGEEGDPECKKGERKLYFFDIPGSDVDGTWTEFKRQQLRPLAETLGQWQGIDRRLDHCWAVLGVDKYVRDTGTVLPAEDQTALDAWLPLTRTTLGVTQRGEPFRNGVPIV